MNKAMIMGRLTRDPELRQTPSGVSLCRFTVAVNRRFGRNEGGTQADFISCVAWRSTAEFVAKHFQKGRMINVGGNIRVNSWTDQTGNKRYSTDLVVTEVNFCGDSQRATSSAGVTSNDSDDAFETTPELTDDLPF